MAACHGRKFKPERPRWGPLPTGCFHIVPDPNSGLTMSRYDLTGFEWRMVEPLQLSKPRAVPRVDDWRVLRCDLPERFGARTTCCNVRWRWATTWHLPGPSQGQHDAREPAEFDQAVKQVRRANRRNSAPRSRTRRRHTGDDAAAGYKIDTDIRHADMHSTFRLGLGSRGFSFRLLSPRRTVSSPESGSAACGRRLR